MADTVRVVLGETEFRDLVAGRVATVQSQSRDQVVEIILSDIGWDRMSIAITDAVSGRTT